MSGYGFWNPSEQMTCSAEIAEPLADFVEGAAVDLEDVLDALLALPRAKWSVSPDEQMALDEAGIRGRDNTEGWMD